MVAKKHSKDPPAEADQSKIKENKGRKKDKLYLITGSGSGVGIEIIKLLMKDKNNTIRVLLRAHPTVSESWRRLPGGVIPYVADLRLINEEERKSLEEACKDVDVIIHLASIKQSHKTKYEDYIDVNVVGTENLLKAWSEANKNTGKILKIVYMSSTAVYGYKRKNEILTEESELKPENNYGISKMMGEEVIRAYSVSNKIKYTIIRCSNIYGPYYEEPFFKVFKLIAEKKMRFIGSGENHLTFIHVYDVAEAIKLAAENDIANNKTYNLSDGVAYTQRMLLYKAAKMLNVEPPKKSINLSLAKMVATLMNMDREELDFLASERILDITKIKEDLKFTPKVNFDDGAKEMVNKFLEKNKRYVKSI
ncbi:MAG: NAD-dependent epimerase/dehydratase family protein [Candidatus Micrarchaeia archaeon]